VEVGHSEIVLGPAQIGDAAIDHEFDLRVAREARIVKCAGALLHGAVTAVAGCHSLSAAAGQRRGAEHAHNPPIGIWVLCGSWRRPSYRSKERQAYDGKAPWKPKAAHVSRPRKSDG